jgi:hypothetical protein
MSRKEAERALGERLTEPNRDADQDDCLMLRSKRFPQFDIMLERGHVVRLSLWINRDPAMRDASLAIHTAEGIGLFSTDAQVRLAYPKGLVRKAADYDEEPAHNLVFHQRGHQGFGYRFEIDSSGRVALLHAGREPALGYIEACL